MKPQNNYFHMRKWIFATIFVGLSFVSNAQYTGDKSFHPHLYMGASAGINSYWGEGYTDYMLEHAQNSLGFIGRVSLGYNFTSVLGLRGSFGYSQHNWPNTNNNYIVQSFEARNFMADITVDVTNWVGGYDYNQTFNLVVFGGAGAANQYTLQLWSSVLHGGLQGNFRLSKYVDFNLAAEANIVQDEYNDLIKESTPVDVYPAVTIGLTYHFKPEKQKMYKKKTWNPRSPKWGE